MEVFNSELSVLIPAYNEEKRIGPCLERLSAFLRANHPSSEIIVSSDGSRDRTEMIVREYMDKQPEVPVRVFHSPKRLGKGGGFKRAIQAAEGRYTVLIDTDLPVPLETITRAVRELENGTDVVAGSRLAKGGSRRDRVSRKFMSYGFHLLVRLLFGMRLDSQCGFKGVKTNLGRRVFARVVNPGLAFDVEFLIRAKQLGANIVEFPVRWENGTGSSLRLFRDSFGMLRELLRILVCVQLSRDAHSLNADESMMR